MDIPEVTIFRGLRIALENFGRHKPHQKFELFGKVQLGGNSSAFHSLPAGVSFHLSFPHKGDMASILNPINAV